MMIFRLIPFFLLFLCACNGKPASGQQVKEEEKMISTPSLTVEDIGKNYSPDPGIVPPYGQYASSDQGGSTSVRRTDRANLVWKDKGYYQRNRDLGQVFNVPAGDTLLLEAIVLRTGNSRSAILNNTAGAPVFLQVFSVTGQPVINDNGTPQGTESEHGFTRNHRADDYLEGISYEPMHLFRDGLFPDIPGTTKNGDEPGHLRYLRWALADPIKLAGGHRYAFLVGFAEAAAGYGFTLGNNNLAADEAVPRLRSDALGTTWWSIRREGDGTLPPTMVRGSLPPNDTAVAEALQKESLFDDNHYETLSPTSIGFPDVDTYRTFEFYLEGKRE